MSRHSGDGPLTSFHSLFVSMLDVRSNTLAEIMGLPLPCFQHQSTVSASHTLRPNPHPQKTHTGLHHVAPDYLGHLPPTTGRCYLHTQFPSPWPCLFCFHYGSTFPSQLICPNPPFWDNSCSSFKIYYSLCITSSRKPF